MDIQGTGCVLVVFIGYLTLWGLKRSSVKKSIKIDVNVFKNSTNTVQRYMLVFTKLLTILMLVNIVLHFLNIKFFGLFIRWSLLNYYAIDFIGLAVSIIGLSFCGYAQIKMGNSWRVGIDETTKTNLVTDGLYKYIRNPTYIGLFIMNLCVFIIWPTFMIFIYMYSFFIFLEIQVCCEEDYLSNEHGKEYLEYKNRTKKYIPYIY